jgi:hypothetical protein
MKKGASKPSKAGRLINTVAMHFKELLKSDAARAAFLSRKK